MAKIGDILNLLKTRRFWSEFALMTIAMFISAAAVYFFLVPSKLVIGSISGLSIVLSEVFTRAGIAIDISVMVFVINAILLILAYLLIDHEFGIKTVYTALILGPMIGVWEKILPVERLIPAGQTSVMGDPWFDLLTFVLILSVSQAILFRINASTGGLDILAKIFNKYLKFDIGLSVTISGAVICCTAFAINPFHMVIIGLIGTWIDGICVDYFMATFNRKKRVCIVSDDSEKIRRYIVEDLERGCSLYDVYGGYSQERKLEVQAILTNAEFASLRKFLSDHQIKAFVTASNVSEVYGSWREKKTKEHDKNAFERKEISPDA